MSNSHVLENVLNQGSDYIQACMRGHYITSPQVN